MKKTKTKYIHQQEEAEDKPFNIKKNQKKNIKKQIYSSKYSKYHQTKKSPPTFCCYEYYRWIICAFLFIILMPLVFAVFSNQLNNNLENSAYYDDQISNSLKSIKTQTHSESSSTSNNKIENNEHQLLRITKQPTKKYQEKKQENPLQKAQIKTESSIGTRAGINSAQVAQAKQFLKLRSLPKDDPIAKKEYDYYQQKYKISSYQELPICVVVPTYNNAKDSRHYHNMDSILQQNYSNYHIVFIDDASNDTTGTDMKKYFEEKQITQPKLTFIINKQRTMAMPNLRMAANNYCKPEQLFIIVDGDDQLLGRQVFKHFNAVFQQKKVWVMYSNFLATRGSVGYSRAFSQATIQRNAYRRSGFVISHLRAFYTKLFTLIKQEDLKDANGNYFKAANDVAICLPILQMAHQKVIYSPELSYSYNSNTGLNNHRVRLKQQKDNERYIRKKKSYEPLSELFPKNQAKDSLNQVKQRILFVNEQEQYQLNSASDISNLNIKENNK